MATNPNRLAGVAYVTIDGRSYALVGKLTYRVSTETRESLLGQDGVHGYKAMPAAGMIRGTFRDSGAISVRDLADASNVTVVGELANGKTVVGRNMWRVGEVPEVDTEEGTFDISWEGPDVRES